MNLKQLRFDLSAHRKLGGRGRFVLASMVIAMAAAWVAAPGAPAAADSHAALWPLFWAGIAGSLAYVVMFAFGMFQWVLEGFDEAGRRHFVLFTFFAVLIGTAASFAELMRTEASAPYPAGDRCWYTLRDRWTDESEVRQVPCPVEWRPGRERGRLMPLVS